MSTDKSGIKLFFIGTVKIAIGITISVITLVIIGYSIYHLYQWKDNIKNKPLETIKIWPQLNISPLKNAKFNLTTKWEDNVVHYKFSMSGYPDKKEKEGPLNAKHSPYYATKGAFTINLLDGNGFKIKDKEIEFNKMTRTVTNNGNPLGLSINDSFYMNPDDYRKIKYWEITWHF